MDVKKSIDWGVAFLPGFLAYFSFRQIVETTEVKEFEFVFYLVLLSMITWFIAFPLFYVLSRCMKMDIAMYKPSLIGTPILVILGFLVGIGFGYVSEKDLFYKFTKVLPIVNDIPVISRKRLSVYVHDENYQGRMNVSVDLRNPKLRVPEAYSRIIIKGGDEYQGWTGFYSTGDKFEEIFVSPACHIRGGKIKKFDGPGILIFTKFVKTIEFVDRKNSECYCAWNNGNWTGSFCQE